MHVEWLEVSVRVNQEAAEAVAEVLSRYAPQGVVFDLEVSDPEIADQTVLPSAATPVTVKAYLAIDEHVAQRRRQVEEGLAHLSHIWPVIPEPVFRQIPDQDWTATWKEHIPVLHLGRRVVIKPSWRSYEPRANDIVLEMDPGMAFGTGLHPTTRLCVVVLEGLVRPGMHILDVGTGTGILAMVAARLGAEEALAIDNDENAVIVARRNVQANGLSERVTLCYGSLADVKETYDVVVVNILAPVIINMARAGLAERLRPDGSLVVSGILEAQVDSVAGALHEQSLQVVEQRQQEEWVALIARR